MRYLARVIVILAVFVLWGCESLQQPVTCNSSLDCPGEQVCISGECLPSVLADCSDDDGDGVCDDYDICPDGDDSSDLDSDGNPDDCDPCPFDYPNDSDGDGVCESSDKCPAGDDNVDTDADGVADACDVCEGFADGADSDLDGIPDGCDVCPQSTSGDSDGDGMCDEEDLCEGFDDSVDSDSDGNPDGCDPCPEEFPDDTDGDGVFVTIGIANSRDRFGQHQVRRGADFDGFQRLVGFEFQDSQIGSRIVGDELGGGLLAIRHRNLDLLNTFHDMVIRKNITARIDNHAGSHPVNLFHGITG